MFKPISCDFEPSLCAPIFWIFGRNPRARGLHLRVSNHGRLFKALMTAHVSIMPHCERRNGGLLAVFEPVSMRSPILCATLLPTGRRLDVPTPALFLVLACANSR